MEISGQISQFLDFLVDAILIVNKDSKIIFANKSCARLFVCDREELLDISLDKLIPSRFVSDHSVKVNSFIVNRLPGQAMSSRRAVLCKKSNGEEFSARISIANIVFEGELCGVATIHDFSTIQSLIDDLKSKVITDPLTKLFNKRHLDIVLEQQSKIMFERHCLGVAYLDLNDFKAINDTFGHEVGDQVLVQASRILNHELRSTDMCFRLGGDEFLVIFNITNSKNAEEEAEGIISKINRLFIVPIFIDDIGQKLNISFSVGVGIYPHDARELSSLIALTDRAMYRSKLKKSPYTFVSELAVPNDR